MTLNAELAENAEPKSFTTKNTKDTKDTKKTKRATGPLAGRAIAERPATPAAGRTRDLCVLCGLCV